MNIIINIKLVRHITLIWFDGNDLVEDELVAEIDQRREPDERAMRLFQSIANSIHSSIQMEIDYPSCRGYESVIFIAATPNSTLKRQYEREIRSVGLKIKVVEQSGMTLKRELQRSDPFRDKTCGREQCMVCQNGGKGNCNAIGVTYELICGSCEHKYIGETSRTAYTRGKEHLRSLKRKEEGSVMWRHTGEEHGSDVPDFTMNVTGVFSDDAMLRQVTEAVLISRTQSTKLINNKNEWNHVSIPRAVINYE